MNQPLNAFVKERIGYLELNRPEKRNALNAEMVEALKDAIRAFNEDKEVKVIVIKAAGKVFCSGADLAYLQSLQSNTYEENLTDSRSLKDLFYLIYTSPKVIIAQIQGHAIAGGCGLATVCDFSFSVKEAKFGYTEVRIGFVPAIVKVFLIRKIGEGKAKQLLLGGDLISASEAKNMGLVNWVVEESELEDTVFGYAQKLIKQNSGQSMALTKEMFAKVQEKSLEEGLEYAAAMNAKARGTADCQKGITAFLNKESIQW
ncbi:enoyl-CoA hydratase/isomerase family protein [Aquiflexum lacus]|uniref:enoyl-CoA hydratase/isomerase family protein n=1 Tax=Aquiflexum lacus TaxID=2483805 RepID=UPI0018956B26|nr:enoyl-CoA hydratase/isomerase family protein [Aquiflexum lacus]